MSKIKVGQVYKDTSWKTVFCITYVSFDEEDYSGVYNSGEAFFGASKEFEGELIAQYPTWQEAVNSKEFNND